MESFPAPGAGADTALDVIVPVYRDEAATRRCIESVLASRAAAPFELIVIDDCSPEPGLSAWLRAQAEQGRLRLLRNETNRGFVASVNRGMAEHGNRDVVLLNSDTEVPPGWLDRLLACAEREPRAATVTPFSNQATICSYPFEGWDGGVPGGLGLAALDALFAHVNAARSVELPTGIGFCMLIRRAALDQCGLFDEAAFGRGYGEESDFSMRAAAAGWLHLLAADVFVYHVGSASFGGDERLERVRHAEALMAQRHPQYPVLVQSFIARDPLAPLREAVDEARAAASIDEALHVLREQRSKALLGPDQRLAALAQTNQRLESLLAQCRSEFDRSQRSLDAAQGFVRDRERDIDQLQGQLEAAAERQAQMAARIEELAGRLAETDAQLKMILNSRTWRYSRAALGLIGRK